ncbi:hypothetical protein E8E14_002898 [Neopestalotiopsis sp. 37M]|nr:hypothetical protein E8E14_002898 [Neopestalotiopsis sp. 37M]
MSDPNIYTVGWICAIPTEYVAAQAFLDSDKDRLNGNKLRPAFVHKNDNNNYTLGRIGKHNVVIAVLPKGQYGTTSAASVARDMLHSFPNIRIGLMVGIGGGAPTEKNDVRLGDIVVSTPEDDKGGVFQYDFGKTIQCQEFQTTGFLAQPPTVLLTAVSGLMAQYEIDGHQIPEAIEAALQRKPRLQRNYSQPDPITDRLYRADVIHLPEVEGECLTSYDSDASLLVARCNRYKRIDNPTIHYGLIASANQLMKDAVLRDKLAREKEVLCFEMEAAGLMNHFPCLVIRGICDYSDTHKNDQWQGYAAMAAAAYAKDILESIPPNQVEEEKRLSESLQEIHTQTSETKTHVEELRADGHHDKIRKWLAAPDPSTNFNKARAQYHEGTGQWLLNSEVYTKWKAEPNSFLWLNGIPGCGKTILSSSVVADLKQSTGSAGIFLYFYFDFTNVDKQSLDNLVRSLIDQLYFTCGNVRKETDDLYSSCNKGSHQPDQESLLALLRNMLQYQHDSEVWIVLDALDECHARNEGTTSDLMSYIKSLRDCTANVHLLVTSRPEHDIRSAIESWARDREIIPLQSTEVKDDINLYIKAKVSLGLMPVRCIVQMSRPRLYTQRIGKASADFRQDIRTDIEILDAVAVKVSEDSEEPRFHPDNRMPYPDEIVEYCSSLAVLVKRKVTRYTGRYEEVEEEITEIQLAHFSVQEYLMSDRLQGDMAREFDRLSANTALTIVCLSYLFSLYHSCQPKEAKENYPLAKYSALYWPAYAAVAEQLAKSMLPIVRQGFASMSAISFWSQIYEPDIPLADSEYLYGESPGAALYYASLLGLRYSTQALIDNGADINIQFGQYDHALLAAINRGHHEIVQLLVDKGAKVNCQSRKYWEALEKAVEKEDQKTVQILVNHSVHDQSEIGYILAEVANLGNEELVRKLINDGADVNEGAGQITYPALLNASTQGDPKIVQLLLDHGADVNVRCEYDGSVLMATLYGGNQEAARILIDNGADVDVQDELGNSALHAAASYGFQEIVQLLIDKGININAQYGQGIEALLSAIDNGHQETVQLLIDNGVNIHAVGANGRTALSRATALGYEDIIKMLKDHGVKIDAQSEHSDALIKASHSGDEGMVKSLLNHGMVVNTYSRYLDVNADSGYLGTALQDAAYWDHEAIVKILLDRGVGINAKSKYFRNALHHARDGNRTGIKEMLIKFEKDQDANHFERPMALSPFFRNEQKESYQEEQTNLHKRKRSDSTQESIAKRPHLLE